MMAAIDDVAENASAGRADDQAGRAIATLAIITPVRAAIDLVVRSQRALLIARIVAIVAECIIARRIRV